MKRWLVLSGVLTTTALLTTGLAFGQPKADCKTRAQTPEKKNLQKKDKKEEPVRRKGAPNEKKPGDAAVQRKGDAGSADMGSSAQQLRL